MNSLEPQSNRTTQLVQSVSELRSYLAAARSAQRTVGLVPTMGALHEGHLSLVRASQLECDVTIVTIFVNPTQFGPNEDFNAYPRTLDSDMASLQELGVELVFAPNAAEIYPSDFSTYVMPPSVSERLEGECRPGHFRGVATVVLKLFNLVPADYAYFGSKDFQQCIVIQRMVDDLNVPIKLRFCPIVREPDGLAMSSRNQYLTPERRQQALAIPRGLKQAQELVAAGERDCATIINAVEQLLREAGIEQTYYVAIAEPQTLAEVRRIDAPVQILIAALAGSTRLLDNCALDPDHRHVSYS